MCRGDSDPLCGMFIFESIPRLTRPQEGSDCKPSPASLPLPYLPFGFSKHASLLEGNAALQKVTPHVSEKLKTSSYFLPSFEIHKDAMFPFPSISKNGE